MCKLLSSAIEYKTDANQSTLFLLLSRCFQVLKNYYCCTFLLELLPMKEDAKHGYCVLNAIRSSRSGEFVFVVVTGIRLPSHLGLRSHGQNAWLNCSGRQNLPFFWWVRVIGPRSSEFRTNISNLNKPRGFEDDVCHFFLRRFWREKMPCLDHRIDSEENNQ